MKNVNINVNNFRSLDDKITQIFEIAKDTLHTLKKGYFSKMIR